jgi:hypothetical protein
MTFCTDCGAMVEPGRSGDRCDDCSPESEQTNRSDVPSEQSETGATRLERLETTDSGAVRKRDSVRWLEQLDRPTDTELKESITPKPSGFTGSSFPTEISNVRITGDAEFVETIAGLLKPFLQMEDHRNRLEINLQQTNDKETDELTGNYALYLSAAERGGQ